MKQNSSSIRPGKYRHFKGNYYQVEGSAKHSETLEEYVVYRPFYGEQGLWIRPLSMFMECVEHQGKELARFEYIDDE